MVNIIGLRYDCGSLIWNIYLDFEKTILQSLSGEQAQKQKELITSIYNRALRIPHLKIDETWRDYLSFSGDFFFFLIHQIMI